MPLDYVPQSSPEAPAVAAVAPIALSVAAPAYNEAGGLAQTVREWIAFLEQSPVVRSFQIVVCNDGSTDQTGAILDALARDNPHVRAVHQFPNRGAAAALTRAIRATTGDWVLLIDSDGQFPIDELPRLLDAALLAGADAAVGRRAKKDSAAARFGTWSSGVVANQIYGTKLVDFNSAFKLVRGPLLRSLALEARGLNYSTEVTARLLERHASIVEIPIRHLPRAFGQSSMKFVRGAAHRLLFVAYLVMRRALIAVKVLEDPADATADRA